MLSYCLQPPLTIVCHWYPKRAQAVIGRAESQREGEKTNKNWCFDYLLLIILIMAYILYGFYDGLRKQAIFERK